MMRAVLAAVMLAVVAVTAAGTTVTLVREEFTALDRWQEVTFPKTERKTKYSTVKDDGTAALRMESEAGASALVSRWSYNVNEYPLLRWRWRTERVYEKGDHASKAGDDYPARVYVLFERDETTMNMFERLKFAVVKKIYGSYPPHRTIGYVWANKRSDPDTWDSPYSASVKIIALQKGSDAAGRWHTEDRDVRADYRRLFGGEPPVRARIGLMNDSDNTGERSTSYIGDLVVYR